MKKHMLGISCLQPEPDQALMKAAGIEWQRALVGFPFTGPDMKHIDSQYRRSIEKILTLKKNGFQVMGITPFYGMYYAASADRPGMSFRRFIPEWAGSVDSDELYQIMEAAMRYAGNELKDVVEYFQISNEMDLTRFRGDMSVEQAARYIEACARGLKAAHPEAKVGINPSCTSLESAGYLLDRFYSGASGAGFDYVGIDSYFGSHHPGTPYDWQRVLDELHAGTGVPIIVQEWGYSSIGEHLTEGWPEVTHEGFTETGEFWVCSRGAWKYGWGGGHTQEVQAEYIDIAMKIFAGHDAVIGSFFYDWQDDPVCFCGRKQCPHECGWGLLDAAGVPKPAYHAFKQGAAAYFSVQDR